MSRQPAASCGLPDDGTACGARRREAGEKSRGNPYYRGRSCAGDPGNLTGGVRQDFGRGVKWKEGWKKVGQAVEGKMEAELREGMQAWRKQHPKATLDEIETELNRQVAAAAGGGAGGDGSDEQGGEGRRGSDLPGVWDEDGACGAAQAEVEDVRRASAGVGARVCALSTLWAGFFSPWTRSLNCWRGNTRRRCMGGWHA